MCINEILAQKAKSFDTKQPTARGQHDFMSSAFSNINSMLDNNMATSILFLVSKGLVASAIGKHTDEKGRKHVISTLTHKKIFLFFIFSVSFLSHIFLEKRRF